MRNLSTLEYPSLPIDSGLVVRKASMPDIHPLLHLINGYAAQGVMLPRTEFEMSENIRDFTLAFSDGQLVGCGALHFYSPTSGEIRSLAVDPKARINGSTRHCRVVGKKVIEYRLHSIFAFTYAVEFFQRLGFEEVERGNSLYKPGRTAFAARSSSRAMRLP